MFTKKDETIILVVTAIISVLWVATTFSVAERLNSARSHQNNVQFVQK